MYALCVRRAPIQAHLRRRREMSHGRSDSENSWKTRRCRGCTRACPYHARSRLNLGKFYFAEANSKAKMTKSRRKIAKLLPASAGAEPTVRFSARSTRRYVPYLEYLVRRRRSVSASSCQRPSDEKAKAKRT